MFKGSITIKSHVNKTEIFLLILVYAIKFNPLNLLVITDVLLNLDNHPEAHFKCHTKIIYNLVP